MESLKKIFLKRLRGIGSFLLILFFCVSFKTFSQSHKTDLVYKILSGENQKNDKLIILLHGMNSNTEIWNDFTKRITSKTLLIAVEAPIKTKINSYRWFDIDVSKKPFVSDINQMIEITSRIKNLIHHLKAGHKINTENSIVAGFSQGAILSLNLALTNPNLISGIGVFSGMLPDGIENRALKEINNFPVFITHGSKDKGIELSHAHKTRKYLKDKGAKVKMTIEKSGHIITDKQFDDFIRWTKK